MDKKWIDCVNKLYCALDLNRRAVSVTFLKTKAEYDEAEGSILKKPINYCQMVASAARGHSIKAKAEDFLCQSGVQVFGLGPLNPCNSKGENWARLGLYKDAELSRTVRGELVYLPQKYFGVTVAPVEKQSGFPDVVLIVSNPYNENRTGIRIFIRNAQVGESDRQSGGLPGMYSPSICGEGYESFVAVYRHET